MARAVARIDLGAVRHNCARLKAELGEGRSSARWSRPTATGTATMACAEAALAGGATRLAVATGGEAERIGRRFAHVPLLTMGALAPEELDTALEAGAEVAAGGAASSTWSPRAPAPTAARRGCTSSTTAAWAGSAAATRGGAGPAARLRREPRPRAGRGLDPLRHRRRTGLRLLRGAARPLRPGGRGGQGRVPGDRRPRRQQRRGLPRPPLALRHGALRRRRLRARSLPGRPGRAGAAPGALAALLRGGRQALRGRATAPATGRPGGPSAIPASACCRSATATASGAASPTTPRCWSAAAVSRWSARSRWTT